jgi:thioredoxin-related protein
MKKLIVIVLMLICGSASVFSQKNAIQWMSFAEALKQNSVAPKKIFIDVYTEWCGWCKRMDATTFSDDSVIQYMNKNFYAVKLDAERKDTVEYKGVKYSFRPEYKANEIAAYLLNGRMGYPTSVYLNEENDLIAPVQGYLTKEQLLHTLRYFATDLYKTVKWDDFVKSLK